MRGLSYTLFVIAMGVWPAAAFDGPTQTTGGTKSAPGPGSSAKPGAAKPAAKDPAKADPKTLPPGQKLFKAGIKAYEAGKHGDAIKHLGSAIRSGEIEKQQMALALYYRGLASRKKGRPGQAISDLTSAVWLKEGLTTAQKNEALSNRNAAYREAGISDAPAAPESVVVATEAATKTDTVAAVGPPKPGAGISGWETATLGSIAAPTSANATSSPNSKVAAAPASNSATSTSSSESSGSGSSGGGIGGFFSSITNLFTGGGSSSSEPAPSQNKEAVTSPPIPTKPQTSSWNQKTQVAAAATPSKPKTPAQVTTPFATQVAAAAPPTKPQKPAQVATPFAKQVAAAAPPSKPKVATTSSGKYRLQVAAVRSRSEADAVAANLMQKYAGKLGQRRPVVDEAVIGSMGTFYRVRVGPYANAKEPQQLCATLRSSGFDCLVVTK